MNHNTPGGPHPGLAYSVAIALFLAAGIGGLRIGLWAADQVVLRAVYGPEEMARQELRITAVKPELKVSNGDELEAWSFRHWIISAVVWVPSVVGLFFGLRRLMPADFRRVADLQSTPPDLQASRVALPVGCLPMLATVILAFLVGLAGASALLAASALSVAWFTHLARSRAATTG